MSLLKGTPILKLHKGRYNVIFYDRETKRYRWHSLGTDKKDVANKRFREICAAYENGDFRPERGDRYEFGNLTLKIATDRFLLHGKQKGWAATTYEDNRRFFSMVCGMFPADMILSHLTAGDCRKVMNRPKSREGKRKYYRQMRSFLNWTVTKGYLPSSPLADVHQPKTQDLPPEYFTREEIRDLVYAINEQAALRKNRRQKLTLVRLSRVIRFDVNSGLRLQELRRLKWKDVDMEQSRILVYGKGDKYRIVPLFDDARAVLDEIREEHIESFITPPHRDQAVFPGLPYNGTSTAFKEYLVKGKFDDRFSFHSLRHTFASWAVMAGVPIYTVKVWMGHTTIKTTERYAHHAPDFVPEMAWEAFSKNDVQ